MPRGSRCGEGVVVVLVVVGRERAPALRVRRVIGVRRCMVALGSS